MNHSNNEQPLVEVHGILSENISYQISKYILCLFTFGYSILQKYFSTLLGSDYIGLWEQFEIIQYLMDPLRGIYVDGLIRRNSIRPIKTENPS
ncbi:unnamed protein product, partial [Sphagnum troendelagicum]